MNKKIELYEGSHFPDCIDDCFTCKCRKYWTKGLDPHLAKCMERY